MVVETAGSAGAWVGIGSTTAVCAAWRPLPDHTVHQVPSRRHSAQATRSGNDHDQ